MSVEGYEDCILMNVHALGGVITITLSKFATDAVGLCFSMDEFDHPSTVATQRAVVFYRCGDLRASRLAREGKGASRDTHMSTLY